MDAHLEEFQEAYAHNTFLFMQRNEYVTAIYYVDTCQKGEIVGQMQVYFGLPSKFSSLQKFRLF